MFHGFLRLNNGSTITIDFPGAASTIASGMNDRGDIAGGYFDTAGVEHGYFRLAPKGAFTSFDPPGTVGTEAHFMNDRGQSVGPSCLSPSCPLGVPHGFLRLRDGTFVDIAYPGAAATVAGAINNSGKIVGDYFDFSFNRHGFVRTP